MNLTIDEWKKGSLVEANWEGLSPEEKEGRIRAKAHNDELEAKVVAKEKANPEYHGEHGYPPELFDLKGDLMKQEAMQFLRYAVVLAKATVKS